MFLVTIGATNYADNIKDFVYSQIKKLEQEGFNILCEHYFIGENLFIKCALKDNLLTRFTDKKVYEDFQFYISRIITEAIIKNWEVKLIKKILKCNYFYLNEKEKDSICNTAQKLLEEDAQLLPGGFYKLTRKNKIMREVLEYISGSDIIIIDGFVSFRLNAYIKELSDTVERAIEIFITEKEYNEFIKLLKYFVEVQECKVDVLHLIPEGEGKYLLLDGSKKKINGEIFEEIRADISEGEINYDDLLISTLITISPRKIHMHNIDSFDNKELVKTITNVFSDRICICHSCDLCSQTVTKETNNYSL